MSTPTSSAVPKDYYNNLSSKEDDAFANGTSNVNGTQTIQTGSGAVTTVVSPQVFAASKAAAPKFPQSTNQQLPAAATEVDLFPLAWPQDNPDAFLPTFNGKYTVKRAIFKMSPPEGGIRVDTIPQVQYHFPTLRMQGYDLTKVTMELTAWDQDSYNELRNILNSVIPPVRPAGNKVVKPKVSKIDQTWLNERGFQYFIPVPPSSMALAFDSELGIFTCKFSFLTWPGDAPIYAYKDETFVSNVAGTDSGAVPSGAVTERL